MVDKLSAELISRLVDAQRGLIAAHVETICAIEDLADNNPRFAESALRRVASAIERNTDFTAQSTAVVKILAEIIEKEMAND